ncbi:MAG: membrane protein insertase YidC [Gammaproteobacteria bacterium]
MDNQRLFLFIALSFVLLLLWEAWQKDYEPVPVPAEVAAPGLDSQRSLPDIPDLPQTEPQDSAAQEKDQQVFQAGQYVRVVTDIFDIKISTLGGDLRYADLRKLPVSLDKPDEPLQLMGDRPPLLFIAQSGLRSPDGTEPTHHVEYQTPKLEYRLAEGDSELQVPLHWTSPEGVRVTKVYTFMRGSYQVKLAHRVHNGTGNDWHGRQYRQLQRSRVDKSDGPRFIYTYTGGVLYSPEEKYEKIDFDDMLEEDLGRNVSNGWVAMIQHYFVVALVPDADENNYYYTKALPGERYVIGLVGPQITVAPGAAAVFSSTLYVGPKLQDRLKELAPGLELTVDYGILTVLSKPLFWLLTKIHSLIGNWGWAIVILTMLIKLAFFKLSETSYKSMANMRKLTPRMKALKERYSDDRQKLNKAMMDLYKTEKINPLGGCLPILVQIPVFIALYWVLLESVELRQAPFMLWIRDLSAADPFFVLPLIMGATMMMQQRLNPAPVDPIQAKVMMVLPLVFTVFFAFFPSGLVLYWVTNNTLSIAQQWVITRRVEQGGKSNNR